MGVVNGDVVSISNYCVGFIGWLWDKKRRNIKIEVTNDCLQVFSRHSSGSHWASVSGEP